MAIQWTLKLAVCYADSAQFECTPAMKIEGRLAIRRLSKIQLLGSGDSYEMDV